MRMRTVIGFLAVAAVSVTALAVNNNFAPKNSIKDVMKIGHKDGLHKKVLAGQASDEEKKQLLDLYIDMLEGTPKKGDAGEWKMVAGAAMTSAAKVVLGREGAIDELKKTSDCMGCHSKFK